MRTQSFMITVIIMADNKLKQQIKAINKVVASMQKNNDKKRLPKERYFKALEDFKAERRIFLKDEIYPAYLLDSGPYGKSDGFYALVAENDELNLGNNLLDRLPKEWNVVEVNHADEVDSKPEKTYIVYQELHGHMAIPKVVVAHKFKAITHKIGWELASQERLEATTYYADLTPDNIQFTMSEIKTYGLSSDELSFKDVEVR